MAQTIAGTFGTLILAEDGEATYTVNAGQQDAFVAGDGESFTYTVTDDEGNTDSATVFIRPFVLRPGKTVGGNGTTALRSGRTVMERTREHCKNEEQAETSTLKNQ